MSISETIKSYNKSLKEHGVNPQAVHWGNTETQYFRFKILAEVTDIYSDCNYTILDYGCGLGDLFYYLLFNGFKGKYIGLDINDNLIDAAKKKYKKYPQAKFLVGSNSSDQFEKLKYDYCFISGVFNEKISCEGKNWQKIIKDVYANSKYGVAFNAISTQAKEKHKDTAYLDPLVVTKFCFDNLTKFVNLRHDYRGGNFSVYLYKNKGILGF